MRRECGAVLTVTAGQTSTTSCCFPKDSNLLRQCEISVSHRGSAEDSGLLQCGFVSVGSLLQMFRRNVVSVCFRAQ
jgi:hypothetical protein